MANTVLRKARQAFMEGEIDLLDDTIKAVFLDGDDVAFDADLEFYDEVQAAAVGTPATLSGKTVTNGVFDSNNPTWTGVTGDEFEIIILMKWTGDAATSRVILWLDEEVSGLPDTPATNNYTYNVHENGWFGF